MHAIQVVLGPTGHDILPTDLAEEQCAKCQPGPSRQPKALAILQEENLRDEKAKQRKDYSKTFLHFHFLFSFMKFSKGREESPQGEYYFVAIFPLAQM